jgi:hypothetical protein
MNRSVDILTELNGVSPLIAGIGNGNVFRVPPGYFDTLPGTVMACLKESDSAMPIVETGDLPSGYFDNLAGRILGKIKGTGAHELQELSPLLADLPKENPFSVPEKYFELLPADIVSNLEEEAEISGVLQDARSIQPFEVPAGYFENLSAAILEQLHQPGKAKIVALPVRNNRAWKYAAAAVFAGAVMLGVYNINSSPSAPLTPVIEQGIAIASDEQKFDETLGSLAEEDIAQYLEKNISEADMAVLTSGLDEDNLPDQDDYLADEETLENFIETISSKN